MRWGPVLRPSYPAQRQNGRVLRNRTAGVAAAALVASASLGHLGYPAALALLTRSAPRRPRPGPPAEWPAITVLVPAYREGGVIGAKIADVEANGYPGPVEVLVVAEDAETACAARRAGACVIEPAERLGKSQAINVGMEHARTEIVVLTDANNLLTEGALAALVPHLEDPGVGAVGGEKVEADAGGEELYWRFESWVKQREWALGTTLGVVGELVAVRRGAWRPIPPDVSSDDLWLALDLTERGYAVAYEPSARSIDPPVAEAQQQWERRTRILSGALYVFWRKRHLLHPRTPLIGFEIVGHKLWRSTLGPLSHLALIALAARSWRSPLAATFLALQGAALAALGWRQRGHRLPRLLSAGAQVMYLQLIALAGTVRFLRGDRVLRWEKPAR